MSHYFILEESRIGLSLSAPNQLVSGHDRLHNSTVEHHCALYILSSFESVIWLMPVFESEGILTAGRKRTSSVAPRDLEVVLRTALLQQGLLHFQVQQTLCSSRPRRCARGATVLTDVTEATLCYHLISWNLPISDHEQRAM